MPSKPFAYYPLSAPQKIIFGIRYAMKNTIDDYNYEGIALKEIHIYILLACKTLNGQKLTFTITDVHELLLKMSISVRSKPYLYNHFNYVYRRRFVKKIGERSMYTPQQYCLTNLATVMLSRLSTHFNRGIAELKNISA